MLSSVVKLAASLFVLSIVVAVDLLERKEKIQRAASKKHIWARLCVWLFTCWVPRVDATNKVENPFFRSSVRTVSDSPQILRRAPQLQPFGSAIRGP